MTQQAIIGVVTNNTTGVFQRYVIQGISEVAEQRGCGIEVVTFAEQRDGVLPFPPDVVGVLVVANAAPDDYIRDLYRERVPVSLISHQLPDIPVPVVLSNNRQGIAALVEHVIVNCNRRHPVFIRGILEQADAMQREDAFHQELMRYNLRTPDTHLLRGDFEPAVAAASMAAFLQTGASFDAVIAADYVMADAAVRVLREAGIAVPEQVSVVGFGDGPEAEAAGLTTVAADVLELGRRAAYQLIGQLEGLSIQGATMLSVHMVIRETCGCHLAAGTP